MSQSSLVHAALVAAAVFGSSLAGSAGAQQVITVDASALEANNCFGLAIGCEVDGVELSTSSGVLARKTLNNVAGFGVSGGASGNEIDIGETLHVGIGQARNVLSIKFLFLFNGPEFSDKAEKASVNADGTTYTLAVGNNVDDASAAWSGPGTVSKCGATTSGGTGCFMVTNPFPDAVSQLDFGAVQGGPPFAGGGTSNSDYSIGSIAIEAQIVINLGDCVGTEGCEVDQGFNLNSLHVSNPGGSLDTIVIPEILPDCRYIPRTCLDLLPPAGDTPATDNAARATLITMGVIKSLDPIGPDKLNPATQQLNVTKLFSTATTSLFDTSGVAPDGLPPLWIDKRWKAQLAKDHLIHGFFFKTDSGVVFTDVFEGLIDVSVLTGSELGCEPDIDDLLAWDAIATGSEVAKGVGGQHIDTLINTGCINPTKVSGTRLSFYSILEITKDTYGPTVTSKKPKVTVNNDAVFARLVETLWKDQGEILINYACMPADQVPPVGQAPLSAALCNTLKVHWSDADKKIKDCVVKTFKPITGLALGICELARETYVVAFENALPATATGPDLRNRVAELKGRVAVFKHVWDERFLASIKPSGFCRERGTCPP
jgi:hypothetical protein